MSATRRSDFDTKIMDEENGDSGFLSGPVDVYHEESDHEPEPASEDNKVCVSAVPQPSDNEYDSGILQPSDNEYDSGIQCISECLSDVQLTDTQTPQINILPPEQKNIPPIVIFFQQDADGDTQLHIASVHGCEKSVGTLIRVCPNKALLDVPNDDGHTPLHLAVMSGNAVVTRMLVRAGLSLGARDRMGETPLHKASSKGHVECLQALLAPVPEQAPRKLASSSVLDQKNYKGQACVHLAASAGHLEALHALVYYGANINLAENLAGWTALHIAARRGDARLVQYLRERCPAVTTNARDYANRTPRRLARKTAAARAFANMADDSDTDSDSDDDMYDSDSESSMYEALTRLRSASNSTLTGCC